MTGGTGEGDARQVGSCELDPTLRETNVDFDWDLALVETISTYDQIAGDHASSFASGAPLGHLQRFRSRLSADGARVLDIGCGSGRDRDAIEHLGATWIGVDLSREMLALASRTAPGVIRADARWLPVSTNSVDGVWCCAGLVHLERQQASVALQEMARVLRPGAPVFVSLRLTSRCWEQRRNHRRWYEGHTFDSAIALLESSGLTITKAGIEGDETRADGVRWISIHGTSSKMNPPRQPSGPLG